jgi:polygalacturonase
MIGRGLAILGAGFVGSALPASAASAGKIDPRVDAGNGVYNIIDFGAVNGEFATPAIQRAIDACHRAGGGKVVVPPGTFITGTIILKSRVNLYLEQGGELLSSENREDFISTFRRHGMIFCEDAYQVSITGKGIINGRGSRFYDHERSHILNLERSFTRQKENYMPEGEFFTDGPVARAGNPSGFTIEFYHCNQVTVQGITIHDTPIWATRFGYCDDVLIEGISIRNNLMIPNSDGLHITVSRNIRISNCDIRAGDDAIVITGFAKRENTPGYTSDEQDAYTHGNKTPYAENIQVTNCHLQSRSSGIRIGYGQHPIRRFIFTNIVIYGSNRGIGIFARDAAHIEELVFSNIIIETRLHNGHWWGNGEPIHLSAISRFAGQPVGQIKDVQFNNVRATGEHGIILYGQKESPMENIQFNNVRLKLKSGRETLAYGGNFDLRPAADQAKQVFEHDVPGFYAQYIDDLVIRDFRLSWGEDLPVFFTNGLEFQEVNNLQIDLFVGTANPNSTGSKKIKLNKTTLRDEI